MPQISMKTQLLHFYMEYILAVCLWKAKNIFGIIKGVYYMFVVVLLYTLFKYTVYNVWLATSWLVFLQCNPGDTVH